MSELAAPVFIVGSMRSGSTMLRLILDSHPHIAIPAETGFMGALAATKTIPSWRYGERWYARLGWTEHELDARLRSFYVEMFERFAASQGKQRWGEKTPFHTTHIPTMAAVFPDAVFTGIVRHPGAVAASLQKNFNYAFPDALSYWAATNLEMVRAASSLGERFVLCRYEELVRHTEPVLREVLCWLGETWSDTVLKHHQVQRDKGARRAADGSTSTRDPVDPTRADRWERTISAADRMALHRVDGMLGFFGYEREDPSALHPLADGQAGWRWLVTGDDLADRQKSWAERLDLAIPSLTVSPDSNPHELAERLHRVEQALARTRSRRSVRIGDALRKVQHGRSWQDVRDAVWLVRGRS